jgi:hypothetical protein
MPLLPIGVCVIGLLSAYTLGISLQQLRPNQEDILQKMSATRIQLLTMAFLVIPLLAAAFFVGQLLLVVKQSYEIRAAHIVLALGLWMVLGLSLFVLVIITRLGKRPSLSTLAAPVFAVPLVAYLTPIDRFMGVFISAPLALPIVAGGLMIAASYFLIFHIRKELL